jgi:hypothetical protein
MCSLILRGEINAEDGKMNPGDGKLNQRDRELNSGDGETESRRRGNGISDMGN